MALLEIHDLRVRFATRDGIVNAVDGVSLEVERGRTLGIVGESGSGKSVTALTVMGLTRLPNATIEGAVLLDGVDLLELPPDELRRVRGKRVAMVFQDPLSSLHPMYRVGWQIGEAIRAHDRVSKKAARARGIELLRSVGIPGPETRIDAYPHELSGGMRQRVLIAMALALDPDLLIADEPTSALDVTVQSQILELLSSLQESREMALLLVSHDLGVIAEQANDVAVMYAGRVVESGPGEVFIESPLHPYTRGLLGSIPHVDGPRPDRLRPIPGSPPNAMQLPPGCAFHPRCPLAQPACRRSIPELTEVGQDHRIACPVVARDRELAAGVPIS
jgi:peptide/nickel transport system ATP-binding protein